MQQRIRKFSFAKLADGTCNNQHKKMSRVETKTNEVNESNSTSKKTSKVDRTDSKPESTQIPKRVDRKKSMTFTTKEDESKVDDTEKTNQEPVSLTPNDPSDAKLSHCKSIEDPLLRLDPKRCAHDMSPDSFFHKLLENVITSGEHKYKKRPTLEVSSLSCKGSEHPLIPPITEEEQAGYDIAVVNAVRENDLDAVQSFHSNGRSLSCCNRFGESLLHMACRRGFESIVLYIVEEADVSVRITDDCGRTPLHDALWHKECQYTIMDLLVRTDPLLLLCCDKYGHTPFTYTRREHWANWRQFLWDRREHMKSVINLDELEFFRDS